MGTSADLAVRYRGQTYFQHTSHDAFPERVLSQLASTLAAAGTAALKARMAQEGPPPQEDHEGPPQEERDDDLELDRKAMGTAYLLACQARGREPVLLDYAMGHEFGNPDFSHGGVISLFAPQIDWRAWPQRIEDVSVILDLDRDVLLWPHSQASYDLTDGGYDRGEMRTAWEVPLADLEDLDPTLVGLALLELELDQETSVTENQAAVDEALRRVREGLVAPPPPSEGPRPIDPAEPFTPSLHLLDGRLDHLLYLRCTVDFFQQLAPQFPRLGEEGALLRHQSRPQEQTLTVDLRSGDVGSQRVVAKVFSRLASGAGMRYRSFNGNGGAYTVQSAHATVAGFQIGAGSGRQWDEGIVPPTRTPLISASKREELIDQILAEGDVDQANNELIFALTGFQAERWRKIQASGLVPLPEGAVLNDFADLAAELSVHFEEAVPGSTAQRFAGLSPEQRETIERAMSPVSRYLFSRLLSNAPSPQDPPAPARSKPKP